MSFLKSISIILIFLPTISKGIQIYKTDSSEIKLADRYLKRGFIIGKKEITDSVSYYFNEAKRLFLKHEKWEAYVNTHYQESLLNHIHNKFEICERMYKNALKLTNAKLSDSHILNVKINNKLGNLNYQIKNYDKALHFYSKALSYENQVGNHKQIAFSYSSSSYVYHILFDLDKALEYLEKSYAIKQKLGLKGSQLASYFDNKGSILYNQYKFEEAQQSFKQALEKYQKLNHIKGVLECYYFLGIIAIEDHDYTLALQWFKKGIKLCENRKNTPTILSKLRKIYLGLGESCSKQKRYDLAKKYFFKARNVSENKKHNKVCLNIGNSYNQLGNYDSALYYYQQGIIGLHSDFNDENIFNNPLLDYALNQSQLLWLLRAKGESLYLKYSSDKTDINYLKAAFQTNNLALQLTGQMLNRYQSVGSKLNWGQFIHSIYEQGIIISNTLYKVTGDALYKEKAFQTAANGKSGTLLHSINTSKAKHFAGVPDSLLSQEKEQKTALLFYKSLYQKMLNKKNAYDTALVKNYEEKIFELNRSIENLSLLFEKRYPKYYQLKYENSPLKLAAIQKNLLPQSVVIDYFDGDSSLYAFLIRKENLEIIELRYDGLLKDKIVKFNAILAEGDFKKFTDLSYSLYKQLIAPLSIKEKNLIIIPDGVLSYLNFDILISQLPQNIDFRQCKYLIKNHSISYQYSAKFLLKDRTYSLSGKTNKCLAFSFSGNKSNISGNYITMRGDENLKKIDLPGTRKEILAISEILEGTYYYGTYANEKNFKNQVHNYNMIHLALHGEINDKEPMNSRLYFSQKQNDNKLSEEKVNEQDNYLHVFELYNMELNSDLVVLSACNTGTGKLEKGEGVMSLGRAFAYAGSESLIISQWELTDDYTPSIMKDFYINLSKGNTKSNALREAKLSFLNGSNNITANPYYWASLVQLGNDEPLPQKDKDFWYVISIVMLLLTFAGFFTFYRRKKN